MELLAKTIAFLAPFEFSPAVLLACAGTAWLYYRGGIIERAPQRFRATAFLAGLLLIYGVLQTHYDFYAQHMFFLHRLQHLVLHHLAPLLIVLAVPQERLYAGLPAPLRTHVLMPLLNNRPLRNTIALIQQPLIAGALFVGLIYFWLIPDVHFIAMLNLPLYNVMNWGMAIDGLLFWWMVFNMRREGSSAARHYGGRIVLLFVVMLPQILLGASIALSTQELFEIYDVCGRVWPLSARVDQQLGGLITWIPAAMMSFAAALLLLKRWLREQGGGNDERCAMSRAHLIVLLLLLTGCGSDTHWHGRNLHYLLPDLAFTLHDGRGHTVTASDYSGKVALLYFGFAQCDDVCPTTLATLARAVTSLGDEADRVRILFVSVDPQRDTPEVLRHHTHHFSPQLIGLSGSEVQLHELTKRYRVAYGYGAPDANGAYEVYHSSAIFVFDGRGQARLLLKEELGAAAIAEDLRRLLTTP